MSDQAIQDWEQLRRAAGGFPHEAFQFVREGLAHTVRMHHGADESDLARLGREQHVSGRELCIGLRDYAIRRYGMLAGTVLRRWGICRTDDFGRIVFAMIDAKLMRKSDADTLEDFHAVYDFDEAFSAGEEF